MKFNFRSCRNRFLSSALVSFMVLGNVIAPASAVQAKETNPTDPKVTAYQILNGKEQPHEEFDTIQAAVNAADGKNPMIIELGPNEQYHQTINIEKKYKNITLKSKDSSRPATIVGKEITSGQTMLTIRAENTKVEYVNFTGLYQVKPDKDNGTVAIRIKASNTEINGCKIYKMGCKYTDDAYEGIGFNAHGIICSNSDYKGEETAIKNVKVTNCELSELKLGNSEALVMNGNVTDFVISGNKVHDCDNIGIDIIGYEKSKNDGYDDKDRARYGEVTNNIVYNISSRDNLTYRDDPDDKISKCAGGIYVDGGTHILIQNNYVENCDIGLELASEAYHKNTDYIEVYDNIFVNNNELGGISIGGCGKNNGYATNCTIENNTIYNEDECIFRIQRANDPTNKITKNIFIAKSGSEIKTYCDDSSGLGIDNNVIENNLVSNDYKKDNLRDNDTKFTATDIVFNKDSKSISFNSNGIDLKGYGYGQSDSFVPSDSKPVDKPEDKKDDQPGDTSNTGNTENTGNTGNSSNPNKTNDGNTGNTSSSTTTTTASTTPSVSIPAITKNATFKDKKSNGKYKITKIIKKNGKVVGGNVEYVTVLSKKCKKVTVPNRVNINGVLFNVTSIGNNAAKNCKKLTNVAIGTNVTKIGSNVFANCKNLKKVNIKTIKLKKIGANAFKGINKKVKFKINKKRLARYTKMIKKAKAPKTSKFTK
ncbi:MAG: leucine-rich repeat protein [Eubacterium sp.]|nr:leucine-rich repeat protein [Eubacterium sp.]